MSYGYLILDRFENPIDKIFAIMPQTYIAIIKYIYQNLEKRTWLKNGFLSWLKNINIIFYKKRYELALIYRWINTTRKS